MIEYETRKDNIYLTGFMGVGKTTVGRRLASDLSWAFVDLDEAVEKANHQPINSIVESFGLSRLRKMEEEVLSMIAVQEHHVVALGAGTLLDSNTLEIVQNSGDLVYLHAEIPSLIQRIENDHTKRRPLIGKLSGDALISQMRALIRERLAAYQKADLKIDTDDLNVASIVHLIEKRQLAHNRAS